MGALHSLLKPYTAGAETLLELAGAHLSLALAGVVEPALQGLADLYEARGRAVAEQASLLAAAGWGGDTGAWGPGHVGTLHTSTHAALLFHLMRSLVQPRAGTHWGVGAVHSKRAPW